MADGFLGRWAKRKNDALQGKPLDEPVPAQPGTTPATAPARGVIPGAASDSPSGISSPDTLAKAGPTAPGGASQEPAAEQPAPLTLDDVQGLTKDSDFKPFMNKAVEPGVRNAAMKKLFTDPHFNVMDRMDIYIDDYSQPDPIPAAMLRQMVSAKFLKLFDDEEEEGQKNQPADSDKTAQAADAQESPGSQAGPTDASDQAGHETETEVNSTPVTAAGPPNDDNPQPLGTSAEPDSHQDNHAHSDLRLQPDHAAESPDPGRSAA